jgi:D-aminopeptidase
MEPPEPRGPRLRELGLQVGSLPAGPRNSVTDVPGIRVGQATVWRDEADPPEGRGVARTGVTAIVPGGSAAVMPPLAAGTAVLNGAGELTGSFQIREWGLLETPVYLTSTMAVGRVYDGAVTAACAADPAIGLDRVVIPVVGECDDSWLSEARIVQVEPADVERALATAADGVAAEGCAGAGTGMVCFGWKGGIGTSSRLLPESGNRVGVLVLANFGTARELRVSGVSLAALDGTGEEQPPAGGSCIAVVATNAPLGTHDLGRVARRCGLGLARTGSVAHHGSGEIFVALSTAGSTHEPPAAELDELFAATVDATEEAVLNALWAAVETTGRSGRVARALPHEPVLAMLEERGLLQYGAL